MINVSEVIQEFGAYYKDEGQNEKRIIRLLTQGAVTPNYMTPIKTKDTIFRLSNAFIGDVIQPFRKGWHPKGGVKFIPNELRLFHIKLDDDIVPSEIEDNWLGFLAGENKTYKDWPFVKYLVEKMYLPKLQSNMESYGYFNGVYKEPTGTETHPRDCMDGLEIQLQRGVDSATNPINFVSGIGELDPATIFDQIELFDDAIAATLDGVYSEVEMNIFVSPAMARAYMRDKRAQGIYDVKSNKDFDNGVDFSKRKVIGLPSMNGSKHMFATPKENLFHLTKREGDKATLKLEENKREVSIMTDYWEGVGIGCNAITWTTLPKTVAPV